MTKSNKPSWEEFVTMCADDHAEFHKNNSVSLKRQIIGTGLTDLIEKAKAEERERIQKEMIHCPDCELCDYHN